MTAQEACFVLRYEGAMTGAQNRDLLLNVLNVIVARFEVDLTDSQWF